jgi:hypothetical protein
VLTGPEDPRLPPGYRLDRSDPDVWVLRRPEGWVVTYFSARGVTREAMEDHYFRCRYSQAHNVLFVPRAPELSRCPQVLRCLCDTRRSIG